MTRIRPQVRMQAQRLRRYISDPSTIRSMLSYEFGLDEPLPTKAQILDLKPLGRGQRLQAERGIG